MKKIADPAGVLAPPPGRYSHVAPLELGDGTTFADVVNIRTYPTDMGRRAEYGEVRRTYLPAERLPASTTVEVEVSALFLPEAVIEVEVMAVLPRCAE